MGDEPGLIEPIRRFQLGAEALEQGLGGAERPRCPKRVPAYTGEAGQAAEASCQ